MNKQQYDSNNCKFGTKYKKKEMKIKENPSIFGSVEKAIFMRETIWPSVSHRDKRRRRVHAPMQQTVAVRQITSATTTPNGYNHPRPSSMLQHHSK